LGRSATALKKKPLYTFTLNSITVSSSQIILYDIKLIPQLILYKNRIRCNTNTIFPLYFTAFIESCQEHKYLGVIFDTSGTDDKEIRSRVKQARKCIACLNGILWSKDIRKEKKLNIYNAFIKSSLLCGSETWRLTENNKRRVEATETDALRRSSSISRKERIRNVTIRQQIGLEGTIIKEI